MNLIDFGLVPHGLNGEGETREGIVLVGRPLGIPKCHIHRLHGLVVLRRLKFFSRWLAIKFQEQRGADHGDAREGHGCRTHPWLHLQTKRREDPSCNGDSNEIVDAGE